MRLPYLITTILLCGIFSITKLNANRPARTLHHGGIIRGQHITFSFNSSSVAFVDEFLGIPFAEAPIGEKRFAKPIEHPGWIGMREAVTRPPTCWQFLPGGFDLANSGARMWLNNTEMSEDCLYLNVWGPSSSVGKPSYAVMVWIYGGAYTTGSSTLDVYNGTILAATQNVIVISMQYRLGAFGFLRLNPPIKKKQNMSYSALGNQGLWDQYVALQWIKQNVKAFGGNPERITVFGESSGAVSASALWLSPIARPLFNRIILQSASLLARWAIYDLEEAHERAEVFVSACGCPSPRKNRVGSLLCLQRANPIELVNQLSIIGAHVRNRRFKRLEELQNTVSAKNSDGLLNWAASAQMYFDVPFKLVVDGELIPRSPETLFAELRDSPPTNTPELLIGANKNEAMYFLIYGLDLKNVSFLQPTGQVILPEKLESVGLETVNESRADFHLITRASILDEGYIMNGLSQIPSFFYGLPFVASEVSETDSGYASPANLFLNAEKLLEKLDELAGDLDFTCPTLEFAGQFSQLMKSKVYIYSFQKRTKSFTFPLWTGVMHGYEIEYVFGMPRSEDFQNNFYRFDTEERKFSDKIMRLWANFAKHGNPNQNDDGTIVQPQWPVYRHRANASRDDYMILDTEVRTSKQYKWDECRFWLHQMPEMSQIFNDGCTAVHSNIMSTIMGAVFILIFEPFIFL